MSKGSEGQVEGSEGQQEESEGFEGQPAGSEGQPEGGGWTDGRTDGQTDKRNFSPFYWTSSPVGATALLPFVTLLHQRSRAKVPLTS